MVDQFIRECLALYADTPLSGEKVATALRQNRHSPWRTAIHRRP
jgi:hypothetical protein